MKYYKIDIKINTTLKPPYFMGSALRGTFGYALKRVTCINPSFNCQDCFAKDNCLYYSYYEKTNSFHKYRFDVILGSPNFDFTLYLLNEEQGKLPYILSSLHKMLTEYGLTKQNHKFNNFTITVNNKIVYKDGEFNSFNIEPIEFECKDYSPNIKIELLTPLRIKKRNQFLRESVELEDILRSIYQREQELERNEKAFKLPYTPTHTNTLKALTYKHLTRKSSRQKTKLSIDGLIGEIIVMGIDEKSYCLLKLGEIIGAGKQTVMGLGKVKVVKLE